MELDIITFEDLRKIQKYEKENEYPYEFEKNDIQKIKEYFARKKKISDKIGTKEYENSLAILEDIFDRRAYKVVRMAFLSLKAHINDDNLLPEEKEMFNKFKDALINYRNDKFEFLAGKSDKPSEMKKEMSEEIKSENNGKKEIIAELEEIPKENVEKQASESYEEVNQETKESKKGYYRIKILQPVPQFLGVDLKPYGPYKENEISEIPEKNAKLLIERKVAEALN